MENKGMKNISRKIVSFLDVPPEVALNIPKLTVISNDKLAVENFTGIIEYSEKFIKLKTKNFIINIDGVKMAICTMTDCDILIEGQILCVRWE